MKKILKISGIILGVLMLSALAVYIFCPGLLTYVQVKKDCPNIDCTIGRFSGLDVTAPEDWTSVTIDGVTVKGPKDALNDSDLVPFKKKDEFTVMVMTSEISPNSFYDENLQNSEDDYVHFLKKFGKELYMDSYEGTQFLREITSKDCLKLRGKDLKVFKEVAGLKEAISGIEKLSYCEHDGLKGFFSDYGEGKNQKYHYALWLFGKEHEYIIRVNSNDKESVYQCLSSVKIEEN